MVGRKEAGQKARLIEDKLSGEPSESDITEAKETFERIRPSLKEERAEEIDHLIRRKEKG